MAVIITVANKKGGVGKSTTVVNVAAAIGAKGKKLLLWIWIRRETLPAVSG